MPEALLHPAPANAPTRYGAGVAGLGTALPAGVVPTEAVAARLGVEADWIVSRTGILERRIAAPGETLVDLAAAAGRAALDDAAAGAPDLVLVATSTPDALLPAAAPQVAHALGTAAGAIDVGAACTGFLSGLALAAAQLESGRADTVLLIGAELLSRHTDPDDRRTAALFGDGAGALVLTRRESPGDLGPVVLASDGAGAPLLRASRERGLIEMDGHEVFRHAVARMAEATREVCPDLDADLFVYHQANARILRAVAGRLGLDAGRVVDAIAGHGNTSAASVPLALAAARADGRLTHAARVVLCAFGAGFTWGAAVLDWRPA